jgi:ferric-dicitrate binding protein FerR (iron transport regulator)
VLLSDGTQVWLNSETQLKYPKNFIKGQTREVELVYGEAYFNVSPSSKHNGDKFKVLNASQHIEVLGTEFNIKAYTDETLVFTTLVEGKVTVNAEGTNQILKPSEQARLNIETNSINVKLVDVYNEISWKEGIFTFEKMPLSDIVKVLSRWYDIDFVFENEKVKENRFNGSLRRDLKIEEILDAIKNFNKIKDYNIYDRTIVIK